MYAFLRGIPIVGGQLVFIFAWYSYSWGATCVHFYATANRSPQERSQQWHAPVASIRPQLVIHICHHQLLEGIVAHDGSFVEQLVSSMPRVFVAVWPGQQANQVTSRLGNRVTSQPVKQSTIRTANQSTLKPVSQSTSKPAYQVTR